MTALVLHKIVKDDLDDFDEPLTFKKTIVTQWFSQ